MVGSSLNNVAEINRKSERNELQPRLYSRERINRPLLNTCVRLIACLMGGRSRMSSGHAVYVCWHVRAMELSAVRALPLPLPGHSPCLSGVKMCLK